LMTDMLNEDEIANLKKTFTEMDENGDGSISVGELKNALARAKNGEQSDVLHIIKAADIDGDGKIDYNELLSTFVDRKLNAKEERMFVAFSKLDQNGDGRISAEELEGVLKKEHVFSADDHSSVARLLKEADKDGDGKIDYEEFLSIMWAKAHPDSEDEKETQQGSSAAASAPKVATPKATPAPAATAVAVQPMSTQSAPDGDVRVVTRAINKSRAASTIRYATLFTIFLSVAGFILAIALRLWYVDDSSSVNCGLFSCCDPAGCGTFDYDDDTLDMKIKAVRAFVVLGFIFSVISLIIAGFAFLASQDLLAKFIAPLMTSALVSGVIGFAIYINIVNDNSLSGNYGAGFAFDIIASILSLLSVALGMRAQQTLISES